MHCAKTAQAQKLRKKAFFQVKGVTGVVVTVVTVVELNLRQCNRVASKSPVLCTGPVEQGSSSE